MPYSELKVEGHNIVIIGSFNPQIFQPAWFANEGLVRKGEAETAKIAIIHNRIVSFSAEFFRLEVTSDRIIFAVTQRQFYEPLRDLALGTFRILRHTPLFSLGLNMDFHFLMESEDASHLIGHRFAPKGPWEGLLENPGLSSLSLRGKRPDSYEGAITVKIEPSPQVNPGVLVSINDHYTLLERIQGKTISGADGILKILEDSWEDSQKRSQKIAEKIVEKD